MTTTALVGANKHKCLVYTLCVSSRWFRYITDAAEAFKSKEVKAGGKAVVETPSPISPPMPTVTLPDAVEAETTTEDEDRPEKEERPVSWDEPL